MEKTPRRDLKAATSGSASALLDAWQAARRLGASEVPHELEDALHQFCCNWHWPRWQEFIRNECVWVEKQLTQARWDYLLAGGSWDVTVSMREDGGLGAEIERRLVQRVNSTAGRRRAWKALEVDRLFAELDVRLAVHQMGEL